MNLFLNKINKIYNYDQKIINALSKILPNLIKYYGLQYENIIYEALENCEIILCNSYETIVSVVKKNTLSVEVLNDILRENENKYGTGLYFSSPLVIYDEFSNKFKISKINRKIIISHTYNLDSPKGIEILTYSLCSLIKSYNNEYEIHDNYIYKRTGFFKEKRQIIYKNNICILRYISSFGLGLEKGLNIFDTDRIVSMVLNDDYKCYEYNSLFKIVYVLKDKLKLKEKLENSEIMNSKKFINDYNYDNLYYRLSYLCDECMTLEQNMIIYDVTREEKDKTLLQIESKLNNDVYLNFEEYLDKSK